MKIQSPEEDVIRSLIKKVNRLEKEIEELKSREYPTARIKADAGDFASGYSFQFVNNTADNTLKVWLEGAWRTVIAAY